MNQRTARLLRRYSTEKGLHYRSVKKTWVRMPSPGRAKTRKFLRKELGEVEPEYSQPKDETHADIQ